MADWELSLPKFSHPPVFCNNLAGDLGLNGSATSSFENSISGIKKKKKKSKEEEKNKPKAEACALFFLGPEGVFTF